MSPPMKPINLPQSETYFGWLQGNIPALSARQSLSSAHRWTSSSCWQCRSQLPAGKRRRCAEGCLDHVGLLFGLFQPFHLAVCLIAHVADGFLNLYYMIHIVHIDRRFLIDKIIVRFSFFIGRLSRNRLFLKYLFQLCLELFRST